MTIGIAAIGPNAGLAVFRTLQLAERIGVGAIGGYAVLAALGANGEVFRAETQRGGTATLFTLGERTGVLPPEAVSRATCAALMSSGPDRPAPLSRFVPARAGIGIVTGHRLPDAIGPEGIPLNEAVLAAMAEGRSAEAALHQVLSTAEDWDAGMIALGPDRGIALRKSARVARRPDLGAAQLSGHGGTAIAVLHNAIWPARTLAPLLAETGLGTMLDADRSEALVDVHAGTRLVLGERDGIIMDSQGAIVRIETTDARILHGRHNCAAVYLGSLVVRDGKVLGVTIEEPNVVVEDGVLISLSGQSRFAIACRPNSV